MVEDWLRWMLVPFFLLEKKTSLFFWNFLFLFLFSFVNITFFLPTLDYNYCFFCFVYCCRYFIQKYSNLYCSIMIYEKLVENHIQWNFNNNNISKKKFIAEKPTFFLSKKIKNKLLIAIIIIIIMCNFKSIYFLS